MSQPHAGIWNPAGPTVNAAGHLLVVSANGAAFPGDAYNHTNSVLELDANAKVADSFAPTDWAPKAGAGPELRHSSDSAPGALRRCLRYDRRGGR